MFGYIRRLWYYLLDIDENLEYKFETEEERKSARLAVENYIRSVNAEDIANACVTGRWPDAKSAPSTIKSDVYVISLAIEVVKMQKELEALRSEVNQNRCKCKA